VNFDFEQYYGNATVDPGMKHGHEMRQKYVNLLTLAAKELGSVGVDVSADLGFRITASINRMNHA
jgi:hypothetical protein